MKQLTLSEISELISGELTDQESLQVNGVNDLKNATPTQITFVGSAKFAKQLSHTNAAAAIVNSNIKVEETKIPIIRVKNADLAMATLLEAFSPKHGPVLEQNIHPSAVIHPTAHIADSVKIGPFCYVGAGVRISTATILYANVSIYDHSHIGAHCTFWSGTVIRENTRIGDYCIFHNNVSIGADGFGYRPAPDGSGLIKIPHIGNVDIGNHVEIGANSCVDKAKFNSTLIGDGCKIDNLVQIGHNSVLGKSCIMAGSSGLAGSVTLGDGVMIGGSASIKDHVNIGSGATVGAGSGVIADVPAGGSVLGYPATESREMLKQWVALKRLTKSK